MIESSYSPILKSKSGEARALIRLASHIKAGLIPFFDILALKADTPNGEGVQTHIEKQANNIAGAWNGRGHCYVDFFDLSPSARGYGGVHPVAIAYEKFSFDRIEVIPVVGIERDIAYKLAVRKIVADGVDAIAIRLGDEDMQLPSALVQRITTLLAEIGASELPLHVFMDFRSIENSPSDVIQKRVERALIELRKLSPARLVFAASAIVSNMGGFKKNSVNPVSRRDFVLWQAIASVNEDVEFADYGVIHPEYLDIDPRFIKPAAKIRYARENDWLIVKGIKWISDTSQHRALSKMLLETNMFRGDECWGAKCILSAVEGGHAFRRLEDWVMIDQNIHITYTVKQLERIKVRTKVSA